jgi:hypothetical protein
MQLRILALAIALAGAAGSAFAQLVPENPDWKELEAPPPPPQRTQGLIAIDMPAATMRFAVDPASISVGSDSIVRYVVVATSSTGTVNAMYEGIRCSTSEVKVYARHNPDSGWVPSRDPQWQALSRAANSRHSQQIARSGVCFDHVPNGSPAQILQDLRAPVERRFQRGGVNRY